VNPTKNSKENIKNVIPCGVALIRDGRRFLISQRKKEDTFGSYWEFPGGKKNEEETFEACVAREVREEVNIEVAVHGKFMELKRDYHEKVIWLNFFLCSLVSGTPEPVDCQEVQWVDVENLATFRFPPANDCVIEKLLERFSS
jgi:mutator protein MutT